ncbi:hypothetical protein JN533_04470 [Staphylococcus aureus]|nr:hypothetical protein SA21331_0543 [Staphylococcus aureus subsp. aureus 21331]EOR48044.1 hypothetical protein M140OLGA_1721 [Staphylococcus aureus subsp. aureus 112808A]KII21470.1 hypothetical protein JN533_04470 [Staphylococcus aureus]KKI67639.1 hypothetical protein UF67_1850 [Staphylococcus aureus]CAQ49484.1 hypothetical protein SAPIG1059 [Staphylococcus aureus subsp. aureus ST398]
MNENKKSLKLSNKLKMMASSLKGSANILMRNLPKVIYH